MNTNSKYLFNEITESFESSTTLCQFCKKLHVLNNDENYYAPLYNINDRTNLLVYKSVKYKKISVAIPRCSSCSGIHTKSTRKGLFISIVVAFLLAIVGFIILDYFGIFSAIASFALIFILPQIIADELIKRSGILTENGASRKNPCLQELVIDGWSMEQPQP